MYDRVKDSGKREVFATGAHRDTASGKGRYDLLPTYAIHRLARHFENGAVKYGDENWRKGIPLRRFLDSALRHTMLYLEGQRDEDHAAAAAWNILAMIETEEMIRRGILPESLNNLPSYVHRIPDKLGKGLDLRDLGWVPPAETKMPEPDLEPKQPCPPTYKSATTSPVFPKRRWRVNGGTPEFSINGVSFEATTSYTPADLKQWIAEGTVVEVKDLDECGTTDGSTPLPK